MIPSAEPMNSRFELVDPHAPHDPSHTPSDPSIQIVQEAAGPVLNLLRESREGPVNAAPPFHAEEPRRVSALAIAHEISTCVMRSLGNITQKVKEGIDGAVELTRVLFDRIKTALEEIKPFARDTAERIYQIARPIFQILLSAVLFAAQSTLFTIGFLTGILNPRAIQTATERICNVWNRQHGLAKGLIVTGAIVAWPITLAASAFFVGGNAGVVCQSSEEEPSVGAA